MSKRKYGFVAWLLAVILLISLGLTSIYVNQENNKTEEKTLKVVTSFYPMYVATLNVVDGMENVDLENLSEPQTGCLHDYQLTPADMVLLSQADVFIVNGGGIESFLTDVAESYPDLVIINATDGISMIEDNAHAWMSLEDYQIQVSNIGKGLAKADKDHADEYLDHAGEYCKKVQQLRDDYSDLKQAEGKKVILFHEAYDYIAAEWGLEVSYVLDLDEERQVSAGEAAEVVRAIKEEHADVLLVEKLYGEEMAESMKREAEAKVLYLDTCVRGEYEKNAYLDSMRSNLSLLKEALIP